MTLSKRAIIPAILAIMLVACNKADTNIPVSTIDESYVTAKSAPYSDGEYRPWYPGDDITIFEQGKWETQGNRFLSTLKYDGESSTSCTFRGTTFTNVDPLYYAIYPYNYTNEINYTTHIAALDIAQTQLYDASYDGDYAQKYNPSVAESTDLDNFEFVNLCGVLRFELAGRGDVASIDVTLVDSSRPLWGRATIDMESKEILSIENSDDEERSKITLDCGDEVSLSEIPLGFAIVIPPTGEDMITISINFTDNTSVNLVTDTADCISQMGVLSVGLSYLDSATLIEIVSIDDIDTVTPEGTLWVISSETDPTIEKIDAVVQKALEAADGVKVVFMDVESLPSVESSISSISTNKVSLSFPELSSIGSRALSLWDGCVTDISLLTFSLLSVAEDAFDGFDTLSCELSLKEQVNPYYNTFDIRLQWSDMEWGSINGERIYTLADFETSGLLKEEGVYPVGDVWWIDMNGDPSANNTTMAGLNAAVLAVGADTPISIRFMGETTAGVETAFESGLYGAKYLKEVDLSCFAAIPSSFMENTNVERIIMSNNITSIGNKAFNDCTLLWKIEFTEEERTEEGGYTIGASAFADSGRDSTEDGNHVFEDAVQIGTSAFEGSIKIKSLSFPRATVFANRIIAYCNTITTLYLTAEGDFSYIANATSFSEIFEKIEGRLNVFVTLYLNEDKMEGGTAEATPDPICSDDSWSWLDDTDGDPLGWYDIIFVSDEE